MWNSFDVIYVHEAFHFAMLCNERAAGTARNVFYFIRVRKNVASFSSLVESFCINYIAKWMENVKVH